MCFEFSIPGTYYSGESSNFFLIKEIIKGILKSPVAISASGWEIWMPVSPKNLVETSKIGINVRPFLNMDRKEDNAACLVL